MTRILFSGCLLLLLMACGKDRSEDITGGNQLETSSVSLTVKPDLTEKIVNLTRSGRLPEAGDFKVRIENTRAEVLREWGYDTMPSLIKVVPGSYKLVAWCGADRLPAFGQPYYYGETKITLKEGDNLDTMINCKLDAVKVAVKFDESFGYDYAEYSVDVKTTGDSLNFTKDERREAYFQPGSLRMRFWLKPRGSEQTYVFYPSPIANVKVQEFYNISLKSKSNNGAAMITIQTDSSVLEIPVKLELPPFYLAKPAPKMTPQGFVSGDVIGTTEGVSKPASVLIQSAGGLTELKIKTTSDSLLALGWPAEIDLMKATAEELAVLRASGLEWSDVLTTQDTIKTTVFVKLDNVIKLLKTVPGQVTASAFEITVKDRFDQPGNAECKLNVNVAPPVFEFVTAPGIANVYARQTEYDVKYISEVYKPEVQYQTVGGVWHTASTSLMEWEDFANCYSCLGRGMDANTDYHFRVRLGKYVLDAGAYRTEEAAVIPNANMDNWWLEIQSNWLKQKTYLYRTYNQGESAPWWANNNVRSTWWTVAPVEQNSCPAVSYVSGALARSGRAAELRSVASGSGYANTSSVMYDESKIPGLLFIGNYNYNKPDETVEYGRSFPARPLKLAFWYQYTPYQTDEFEAYIEVQSRESGETKVLGSGTFRLQRSEADAQYQQAVVDVVYTDKSVRATHMFVRFLSSTAGMPATEKNVSIDLEGIKNGWKAHVGSRLRIDDIEIVY